MARPRSIELRERQINIKLTEREFEFVCQCAAASGMRAVEYSRARLLTEWRASEAITAGRSKEDPTYRVQLSRLGNNLNQIVRRMNSFDEPCPPSLEPLLQEIRTLITRSGGDDR
jgi:hypothetical protein